MQSGSPYLLPSNVNEPVSLPVRIIMRPIIHVGRYFITYSICMWKPSQNALYDEDVSSNSVHMYIIGGGVVYCIKNT